MIEWDPWNITHVAQFELRRYGISQWYILSLVEWFFNFLDLIFVHCCFVRLCLPIQLLALKAFWDHCWKKKKGTPGHKQMSMPQFMSGEASASVFKFSTRIVPTFLYLQNHGLCWIHIYDSLTCKWSPSQESSRKWDPLNSHASLFHIPCTFCQFHHHHDGRY